MEGTASAACGLRRVEQIMGMPIAIDVRDAGVDQAAVDRAFQWFRQVDATFSTYDPASQISRLNSGLLSRDDLDSDVRRVLDRCDELAHETDGYFQVWNQTLPRSLETACGATVTVGLDPSGYVKGWAVDRAATVLEAGGACNYAINAGGDVRVRGGALPDRTWRIGIQHPRVHDKSAAVVEANDLAIATSGTYARGEHIIDPHTGRAPAGMLSATVTGADLGTADAYATAIFAMGEQGPAWTTRLFGYEAMVILADDTVLMTRWFPKAEADTG